MTHISSAFPDDFGAATEKYWESMTNATSKALGADIHTLFSQCGVSVIGFPSNNSLGLMIFDDDGQVKLAIIARCCLDWKQKQVVHDHLLDIAHRLIFLRAGGWKISATNDTDFHGISGEKADFGFLVNNPHDEENAFRIKC